MTDKSRKIWDLPAKLVGIPLAGIVVIVVYNFVGDHQPINWQFIDYAYFMMMSLLLWNGNVAIHYRIREQLNKIRKIYLRLPIRYVINIVFTWIASLSLIYIWNLGMKGQQYDLITISTLQAIIVLVTLQVSTFYEIVYLNNERESDIVKIERSEKLKIQAQLDALKNQIDPHFIFNSLNTLSYLISQNPENAKLFNDTLAKVYRYILLNKEKDLVLLKEEIEFASNYFYLLRIRYQKGLNMKIEIDDIVSENYLVPPLSLQMLIENSIKHNHFSEKAPLTIEINIYKDLVITSNNRNNKQFEIQSSKIGLMNLNERYKLTTGNSIEIIQDIHFFRVKLPILKS